MTEKLPGVGPDGVLTIGALKELLKDTHGYPTLRDLRLVQAQHGVDLAYEAEAVAAAVKAERERVLDEVRKAMESTTRLSLVGFQPEDYNHPAFLAGAKCQMGAILEKLANMGSEL